MRDSIPGEELRADDWSILLAVHLLDMARRETARGTKERLGKWIGPVELVDSKGTTLKQFLGVLCKDL